MEKVLLVEDAQTLREVLSQVLESEGFFVEACASAEEALVRLQKSDYDCVLSDFRLPQKHGIDLLREIRSSSKSVPFIIMTAYASVDIAVEAMKCGANDFICKPFEPPALCGILRQVIKHRRILDRDRSFNRRPERSFLTEDSNCKALLTQACKVAGVDTSVLILGETGTGKELLARYIHEHSNRSAEPFVAVNCAAMPSELLESEFFGHESGAFTGATQARVGIFEYANKGTIFLDEVGDMPLPLQVKLLRALQEHEIKRVGGNKTIKVSPRIIAATNQNLEKLISEGKLREDFYYRIAVVTFVIPSLRERKADLPLLCRYFLEYFSARAQKSEMRISESALTMIQNYDWPGNTRELENTIERAVLLAETDVEPSHLGLRLPLNLESIDDATRTLHQVAEIAAQNAEREIIEKTLAKTAGNKSKAARILGVSYKTLLHKAREYGLDGNLVESQVAENGELV